MATIAPFNILFRPPVAARRDGRAEHAAARGGEGRNKVERSPWRGRATVPSLAIAKSCH